MQRNEPGEWRATATKSWTFKLTKTRQKLIRFALLVFPLCFIFSSTELFCHSLQHSLVLFMIIISLKFILPCSMLLPIIAFLYLTSIMAKSIIKLNRNEFEIVESKIVWFLFMYHHHHRWHFSMMVHTLSRAFS